MSSFDRGDRGAQLSRIADYVGNYVGCHALSSWSRGNGNGMLNKPAVAPDIGRIDIWRGRMKRLLLASLLAAPLIGVSATAHAAGNSGSGSGSGTYSAHASCVGWGASQTATSYPGAVPDVLTSTGIPVNDFVAFLRSLGPNCGLVGS